VHSPENVIPMPAKFKINSATHQSANHNINVVARVLKAAKMDYGQWANALFETGCRFVERNIANITLQKQLLENERFGFWDWWMIMSIKDDESLLAHHHSINNPASYAMEKERLLNLLESIKRFDYFLKSNMKVQALKKT